MDITKDNHSATSCTGIYKSANEGLDDDLSMEYLSTERIDQSKRVHSLIISSGSSSTEQQLFAKKAK